MCRLHRCDCFYSKHLKCIAVKRLRRLQFSLSLPQIHALGPTVGDRRKPMQNTLPSTKTLHQESTVTTPKSISLQEGKEEPRAGKSSVPPKLAAVNSKWWDQLWRTTDSCRACCTCATFVHLRPLVLCLPCQPNGFLFAGDSVIDLFVEMVTEIGAAITLPGRSQVLQDTRMVVLETVSKPRYDVIREWATIYPSILPQNDSHIVLHRCSQSEYVLSTSPVSTGSTGYDQYRWPKIRSIFQHLQYILPKIRRLKVWLFEITNKIIASIRRRLLGSHSQEGVMLWKYLVPPIAV